LGDPLKGNLLLFYKPLHLEAQQVSTRIEVRRHQEAALAKIGWKNAARIASRHFSTLSDIKSIITAKKRE
jgi:hypothetical protein